MVRTVDNPIFNAVETRLIELIVVVRHSDNRKAVKLNAWKSAPIDWTT